MIIQVVFFILLCNPCFKILPFYIRRAEALKLYGLALKASMKQNGDGTSNRAKDDKNIEVSFPSRKWLHLKLYTDNLKPIKANIFYWPQPVDSRDKAAFPDISCFPVYPTCSTFSRAFHLFHSFPRLPLVTCFPALSTCSTVSRACQRQENMFSSHAWVWLVILLLFLVWNVLGVFFDGVFCHYHYRYIA